MSYTVQQVKDLRNKTGAGLVQCKDALEASAGDLVKAEEWLRLKGITQREARSDRKASEGWIYSYSHNGKIGVLVEVNCETDFVARSDAFQEFVKNLALHIAAAAPVALNRADLDKNHSHLLQKEVRIADGEVANKPLAIQGKIIQGKLNKFYKESCLMEQNFIKNEDITIEQYLTELTNKVKENVVIRKFHRITLGQDS